MTGTRTSLITLCAMITLLAGCGPAALYDEAPDLTGRYRLASWKSLEWTEGRVLSPPDVNGVMGMVQHRVDGEEAVGTVTIHLQVQGAGGGSVWIRDDIYRNDSRGQFASRPAYAGVDYLRGQYTFEDGILTTNLLGVPSREPQLMPVGLIRWEPCGPTWEACEQSDSQISTDR